MLDAWIIDRLRREEERRQEDGRIPLHREIPEDVPQHRDSAYPMDEANRGTEDIDFRL